MLQLKLKKSCLSVEQTSDDKAGMESRLQMQTDKRIFYR